MVPPVFLSLPVVRIKFQVMPLTKRRAGSVSDGFNQSVAHASGSSLGQWRHLWLNAIFRHIPAYLAGQAVEDSHFHLRKLGLAQQMAQGVHE